MRALVEPAHFWAPPYTKTFGPEVADLCDAAGFTPDPEQRLALDVIFGRRDDNLSAAFETGVVVGRQNLKTGLFLMAAFGWMWIIGEGSRDLPPVKLIVYSAHEFTDLDVDTPILSPRRGWVTMGDLAAGDEVFAPDGQPTKVLAAHPVLRDSDCYRVRFADGQELVAGSGHLWPVTEVPRTGSPVRRVVTTGEMFRAGCVHHYPRKGRDRNIYRWRLDLPRPLNPPPVGLPLHPWLLGVWLGDGQRGEGRICQGAEDLPYMLARLDELGEKYRLYPDPRWPDRVTGIMVYGLRVRLRQAGVLHRKHIPPLYWLASASQRRQLLRGLADTDGTVSDNRQLSITMVNQPLMVEVTRLLRSLGYRATLREFAAQSGYPGGSERMWRAQFAPNGITPFGMPRKTEAIMPLKQTRSAYNAVVAVEPVLTRPTRCITVAHESGCYLAGEGFVPTHNTAMETFRIVSDIVTGSDMLRADVKRVIRNHGEEAIELKWGSRLIFKTRTKGGSRGLTGDKVILDEAFALRPMHMGALLPTISARPDPQVLYGSSAGMADSDVLRDVRDRGRAGGEPRLAYLEWCAPPAKQVCEAGDACTHARGAVGCGCESPDNWVRANPALGRRRSNGTGLSFEYVTAERRAMPPREFCRERMGWWDDPAEGASPLPMSSWMTCCKVKSRPSPGSVIAVGLDISPDSAISALGVAAWRDDGLMHVELAEHLPGTGWVLDRLLGIVGRRNPCAVVLDPSGPAGAFERHLRQADFITLADDKPVPDGKRRLVLASGRVLAQACGAFANMVANQELGHPDQQPLNSAVESVRSRPVAQAWAYRPVPGADITPVAAVTLAAHGLAVHGKKQPPTPFLLT